MGAGTNPRRLELSFRRIVATRSTPAIPLSCKRCLCGSERSMSTSDACSRPRLRAPDAFAVTTCFAHQRVYFKIRPFPFTSLKWIKRCACLKTNTGTFIGRRMLYYPLWASPRYATVSGLLWASQVEDERKHASSRVSLEGAEPIPRFSVAREKPFAAAGLSSKYSRFMVASRCAYKCATRG